MPEDTFAGMYQASLGSGLLMESKEIPLKISGRARAGDDRASVGRE